MHHHNKISSDSLAIFLSLSVKFQEKLGNTFVILVAVSSLFLLRRNHVTIHQRSLRDDERQSVIKNNDPRRKSKERKRRKGPFLGTLFSLDEQENKGKKKAHPC